MNTKQSELEGRLDDLLSRIAMETQEIGELEQQLTDGQILANEALQQDLQSVICGLQEYLRGLRQQARRSQQQVQRLQTENQTLQLHLEDAQRNCRQLEDAALLHTQNMQVQQEELSLLQTEAQALRQGQEQSSRRQAALEAELLQLREELNPQEEVQTLQSRLDQTRTQMGQFPCVLSEREEEQRTPAERDQDSSAGPGGTLCSSVQQTSTGKQQVQQVQQVQRAHGHNQDNTGGLQAELTRDRDPVRVTGHLKDQKTREVEQDSDQRLKEGLQRLRDQRRCTLVQQNPEEDLHPSGLQLQAVQQERDALLQQLRSLTHGHQRGLDRLNRKLRQMDGFMRDADRLTAEQLSCTTDQLRALNHTVELLHAQDVGESAGAGKRRPRQRPDRMKTRTRTRTSTGTGSEAGAGGKGRGWFVPAGVNAPSVASQGTQDSGLGLQYLSSPDRGPQRGRPPPGGGYWVYVPPTHTGWRNSSSDEGTSPPPGPTAGVSAGTSPVDPVPASLLCGRPAEPRDPQGHRCVCECVHEEAARVQAEKTKLRLKTKKLQHTLRRHRRVMQVCEEVACVEKTLMKRRAELRQADRRLLETQSCVHTSREQTAVLQSRARDGATCLLEATQQLRDVWEEAGQLRRRRREREQALKEMEEVLRSRDEEFQQLCRKTRSAAHRLGDLLSDCQEAQRHLDLLTYQEEQQEQDQVQDQDQEHQGAVGRVEELREEEQRLKVELSFHRAELKQVLQELLGEQQALRDAKNKRTRTLQQLCRDRDELGEKKKELGEMQDQVQEKRKELGEMQDQVQEKRKELAALQQEVTSYREEAASRLNDSNQRRAELQEVEEEVRRRTEERSGLQEQCCHLEARRRHADRCLSLLQVELCKRREEQSQGGVVKDTAANQQLCTGEELRARPTGAPAGGGTTTSTRGRRRTAAKRGGAS